MFKVSGLLSYLFLRIELPNIEIIELTATIIRL